MIRLVALGPPFLVGLVGLLAPANLAAGEPDFDTGGVAFLQTHCLKCHGAEKPKAGLPLHTFTDAKAVLKDYKLWEVALRKIENDEMPPEEQPQPSAEERKAFAKSVRAVFEKADTTGKPDPGRVPIRRLNRTEYANTVRDLLQLDLSLPLAADFPTDPVTHGFDNISDALTISPVLLDRYLASAEMIAERAIRSELPERTVVTPEHPGAYGPGLRPVAVPVAQVVESLGALARNNPMDVDVRFNLARTHAAAYALKSENLDVLRGRETGGVWFGGNPPHLPFDVALTTEPAKQQAAKGHLEEGAARYREVLKLAPDHHAARLGLAWCQLQSGDQAAAMKEFRAAIDAAWVKEKETKLAAWNFHSIVAEGSKYLLPLLDAKQDSVEIAALKERVQQVDRIVRDKTGGEFRLLDSSTNEPYFTGPFRVYSSDGSESIVKFSAADDFLYRAIVYVETSEPVRVALFSGGPSLPEYSTDEERNQLFGDLTHGDVRRMKILKIAEVTARSIKEPQRIEVLVSRRGRQGPIHSLGIALVKPKSDSPPVKLHFKLEVEGPLTPISHGFILGSLSDTSQKERTREIIGRLLPRAFRRPVTEDEVNAIAKFADRAVEEGHKWEVGMQRALMAMLCSPKFLFRVELDDRPDSVDPHPLGEFHLASRLSYFLWSSMPDDELFDLASKGKLTANLDAQVRRMLKDPKSIALVDNFAMQWLYLSPLQTHAPDPKLYPQFDRELREAMLTETKLFLHSIIREDRSLLDLISSDYTFLNGRLGGHYGIVDTLGNGHGTKVENRGPSLPGDQFVRVKLQGSERGGLLTQASILTVTSSPMRTSPVKRGAWVLEKVLGTPPPPPPPNVPELDQEQTKTAGSLREKLEQHRANAVCASCHAKIDPLGFAFENYDAIGAFRKRDGNTDIDASGTLPDGRTINGVNDLKKVLFADKDLFVRSFTERLLTYALGRGVEYYDKRAVDRIVSTAAKDEFQFSQLVIAIAQSDPFRLRQGKDQAK